MPPLTSDQLRQRLRESESNSACPFCSETRWDSPGHGYASLVMSDRHHLAVVAFICANCGFVRLHSLETRSE
jgi:hypothetical protein